jgi:hypothetical protein
MKKISLLLALLAFTSFVNAASVTIEGQSQQGDKGSKDSVNYLLSVKEAITNEFFGDVTFVNYQQETTNALSTRLELGVTGTYPVALAGGLAVYTRAAFGDKYSNTGDFNYYSIEPGVTYTLGKVTAKVGYRYRTAVSNTNVNNDTTDTVRAGLSYALTKKDSISLRYDRERGDRNNHGYNLGYTRSF